MHMVFLQVALFSRRACSEWASGLFFAAEQWVDFPAMLNELLKLGQAACIL